MKQTAKPSEDEARRQAQDLDVRYGEIGIPAVAAALQYQSEGKSAPTPVVLRDERWLSQMAAA